MDRRAWNGLRPGEHALDVLVADEEDTYADEGNQQGRDVAGEAGNVNSVEQGLHKVSPPFIEIESPGKNPDKNPDPEDDKDNRNDAGSRGKDVRLDTAKISRLDQGNPSKEHGNHPLC